MPRAPSLRDLQLWMRWIVTDPRGVAAALADPQPLAKPARYQAPAASGLAWIESAPPLSVTQRLDIYAEGYFARLVDVLANDYARTRARLGQDPFRKMVADYLKQNPSRSPDIGEAGRGLPAFAKTYEVAEWPYLADLLAVELLIADAFMQTPEADFDPQVLTRLAPEDWPQTSFRLDRSLAWFDSAWDLVALWQGHPVPRKTRTARTYQVNPDGIQLIDPIPARLLRHMSQGRCLSEILRQEGEADPEQVMAWFAGWLKDGTIRELRPRPRTTAPPRDY